MSRLARIILLIMLLVGVGSVAAQDGTSTADQLMQQVTPGILGVAETEALPILINARGDLEVLATTVVGSAERPVGWSGSLDVNDPQLPLWIRLDLETLAGAVLGADQRPVGWFGVVASVPLAVARDIRHDLELLADNVVGTQEFRPGGWTGDDPLMRCSRATQALFAILQNAGIDVAVDFTQPGYCAVAETTGALYVEQQIVQPSALSTVASTPGRYPYLVDTPFVVAFLDRFARNKIGVLSLGTTFEPIARSAADFSNMMLVRGDNFQVFVDYTTTQITNDQFLALPDIGLGAGTNCRAEWCGKNLD